ncbi:hypothetical protein TA3x_005522 [Tundrisphaera sp. TA3]|uniref:hypothetical protein n=1 Tax=Tundrisphaera sp. TA3 TaxID=3435775 RepID=UPI003EC08708
MDDKTLDLRLEASRAAQERSRLAFFTTTVISFAMITSGWNAYLSFYRDIAFAMRDLIQTDAPERPNNRLGTQELQRQMLREWTSSRMVNVSLLGIRVGVDDMPTIGAAALAVSLIWFYLSMRREHYIIGFLLHDYKGTQIPTDLKWRIFYGVNSYAIFTNVKHSDSPFTSINEVPGETSIKPLRPVMSALYYLPIIALTLLLALDIWSLFRPSPLRCSDQWLIRIIWDDPDRYFLLTGIVFWWIIALLLAYPILTLCKRISCFDHSTELVLKQFLDIIELEDRSSKSSQESRPATSTMDSAGEHEQSPLTAELGRLDSSVNPDDALPDNH